MTPEFKPRTMGEAEEKLYADLMVVISEATIVMDGGVMIAVIGAALRDLRSYAKDHGMPEHTFDKILFENVKAPTPPRPGERIN